MIAYITDSKTLDQNFQNNYIQTPQGIKTPPTLIHIRGDKAYVSGHGPQNLDGSIAGPFGNVVVSTADTGPANNSSPKELSIE